MRQLWVGLVHSAAIAATVALKSNLLVCVWMDPWVALPLTASLACVVKTLIGAYLGTRVQARRQISSALSIEATDHEEVANRMEAVLSVVAAGGTAALIGCAPFVAGSAAWLAEDEYTRARKKARIGDSRAEVEVAWKLAALHFSFLRFEATLAKSKLELRFDPWPTAQSSHQFLQQTYLSGTTKLPGSPSQLFGVWCASLDFLRH